MRTVRVRQIKNPWLILVFLPFVIVLLFLAGLFMLGSALFRKKPRGPVAEFPRKQAAEKHSSEPAIEAEFRTLPG